MNKQEDKFFDMYRDSFQGFQPEAPASIYAGVRNKMMWSNFMTFNLTTLNVWYLGLMLLGGLGTIGYVSVETSAGQITAEHNVLQDFQAPQLAVNESAVVMHVSDLAQPLAVSSTEPTPTQIRNSSGNGVDNKPAPVVTEASVAWNSSDDRRMSLIPVATKLERVKQLPPIQAERVAFTVENALQIELNDLVSQIENKTSGEILIKLPVLLPATDQ